MTHISAAALKQKMAEEEVLLVDVRQPYEHAEFNIGGRLIPLDNIIAEADSIPKDKPVIVYCRKGIRSQIAIQRLEQKFGFTNLVNLTGGVEGW